MDNSSQNGKVLIIGAGLGGLALAQVLQHHNVPFEIFERDESADSRKQGWAVALVKCLPSLFEMLPSETAQGLYTCSVNYNTAANDEIAIVDAVTGERAGVVGNIPQGKPGSLLRGSRERLRKYLWNANDLPVQSGKRYTHFSEDEEGVTAFFTDGSSARGSLLVGADGLHSHVLDQLIAKSKHQPTPSQYIPIFGEVDLPQEQFLPLRSVGNAAILAAGPRFRQQLGLLTMAPDMASARAFWAMMPRREEPEELVQWVQNASQQELYDYVLEITKDFHPILSDLVKHGGPEALAQPQPKFMEYVTPDDLPDGRITVLGDAAHAMIPFLGLGANTAMLDSCDMGRLLVKAKQDGRDFSSVVPAYKDIMVPRGRDAVLRSRESGVGDENAAKNWLNMFPNPNNPNSLAVPHA